MTTFPSTSNKEDVTQLTVTNYDASTSNQQSAEKAVPCKKTHKRKRSPDNQGPPCLRTRMSPTMLLRFITSDLSEQQVSDIKEMGFEGLLSLKTDTVPGSLAYWLVCSFNSTSNSYMNGKLHITDDDVYMATGIPMGGTEVILASTNDKNADFLRLKRQWLQQFGPDVAKVNTVDILKLMITQKAGGEAFKRNFIVFIVSCFLMGVKGTSASLRILKSLADVSCIPTLNWCHFTRKQFIEGVDFWRVHKNDWFAGPIMVYVFIYLDRVAYRCYSVPRIFPTLSRWTKDAISDRIKSEILHGFGTGSILRRLPKSSDRIKSEIKVKLSNVASEEVAGSVPEQMPSSAAEMNQKNVMKDLAESATNLADSYARFSSSLAVAKVNSPECKLVQQLAEMADALYASRPSSQPKHSPTCDVPVAKKSDDIEDDKQQAPDSTKAEHESRPKNPWAKLHGQSFDSEDELWAAIIKLEIALGKQPASVGIREEPVSRNLGKQPVSCNLGKQPVGVVIEKQPVDVVIEKQPVGVVIGKQPTVSVKRTVMKKVQTRRSPRFRVNSQRASSPPSGPCDDIIMPPSFDLGISPELEQDKDVPITDLKKASKAPFRAKPQHASTYIRRSPRLTSQEQPLSETTSQLAVTQPSVKAPVPVVISGNLLHSKAPVQVSKISSPIYISSQSQEEILDPLNLAKMASTSFSRPLSPPVFTPPHPSSPVDGSLMPSPFNQLSVLSQEDFFKKIASDSKQFCEDALKLDIDLPEVEPLNRIPPRQPSPIRRTRVQRAKIPTEVFRSPYLQRSIKLDGKMSKIQREVLDYVFQENTNDSEMLFKSSSNLCVSRADLKNLVCGNRVPDCVIHAWCYMLNEGEKLRSSTSPSRFYLTNPDQVYDTFTGSSLIFVPVVSEKPYAVCFNFLVKKLEILHLMKSNFIDYETNIVSMKEYVIKSLVHKMPSVVEIEHMKVEEINMRTNLGSKNDSGVYLMRLLEKYKGERNRCSLGLTDENHVKLFASRVCYELLCFGGNLFKDKVEKTVGSFSSDIRNELGQVFENEIHNETRRQHYPITDVELLALVIGRTNAANQNDDIVKTEWISITRKSFLSLRNRQWVSDSVIDMFGVLCTHNRPNILYLPSTVHFAKPELRVNDVNIVWCPYLKMHYKPKNAETVEKVFMTINKSEKHWLACVSDLKKKKNYILDSMLPYKEHNQKAIERHVDFVVGIIKNFTKCIPRTSDYYNRLKEMSSYATVILDVPQQPNTFDCGIYVIKYLEATALNNTTLWMNKQNYSDLLEYRRHLMLRLLKWDKNTSEEVEIVTEMKRSGQL